MKYGHLIIAFLLGAYIAPKVGFLAPITGVNK